MVKLFKIDLGKANLEELFQQKNVAISNYDFFVCIHMGYASLSEGVQCA